jgi:hypothetical protein
VSLAVSLVVALLLAARAVAAPAPGFVLEADLDRLREAGMQEEVDRLLQRLVPPGLSTAEGRTLVLAGDPGRGQVAPVPDRHSRRLSLLVRTQARASGLPADEAIASLWLRAPGRSLKERLHLPALPRQVAGTLRASELRGVLHMANAGQAEALAAWLRERLAGLARELRVQLLGFSSTLAAVEVTAEGPRVSLYLPLGPGELQSLLRRLLGLQDLLLPHLSLGAGRQK